MHRHRAASDARAGARHAERRFIALWYPREGKVQVLLHLDARRTTSGHGQASHVINAVRGRVMACHRDFSHVCGWG